MRSLPISALSRARAREQLELQVQRTGADPAAPGERTWHTIFVDGEAGAGARSLAGVCAVRLGERGKVYRFRLSARSPVVARRTST